jgi:hypothetical protein
MQTKRVRIYVFAIFVLGVLMGPAARDMSDSFDGFAYPSTGWHCARTYAVEPLYPKKVDDVDATLRERGVRRLMPIREAA